MEKLSKSYEDYLEAIYLLEKEKEIIKSVTIASMLKVSRPAVNQAMNELKELGYVDKTNYSKIALTSLGRTTAIKVLEKHDVIHRLLLKLGVPEEEAATDCCKIEHVISDVTFEQFKKFIK